MSDFVFFSTCSADRRQRAAVINGLYTRQVSLHWSVVAHHRRGQGLSWSYVLSRSTFLQVCY